MKLSSSLLVPLLLPDVVHGEKALALKERALYWLGPADVPEAAAVKQPSPTSADSKLRNPTTIQDEPLAAAPGTGTTAADGPNASTFAATTGGFHTNGSREDHGEVKYFNRISSFYPCSQLDKDCDTDTQTSAQFLDVSTDGLTVIYTDPEQESIGFVDISNPSRPVGMGNSIPVSNIDNDDVAVPTAVKACGDFAIVTVRTSKASERDPSGHFLVVNMANQKMVRNKVLLRGQPSGVDFTTDCSKAVITVENERSEEWNAGMTEQNNGDRVPAGFLQIVDTSSVDPTDWTMERIDLTGLGSDIAHDKEPEPESVSISDTNIAAVTLQENNGIVLIDLDTQEIVTAHSAGDVVLSNVDMDEDKVISLITAKGAATTVPREPDGIDWLGANHYVTADDGDWQGGGRGFTIWNSDDNSIVYTSGGHLDHQAVRLGHYPEQRSENRGTEPENVIYARYGDHDELLFVNTARTGLAFVYNVRDKSNPILRQVLPAGHEPQGGLAIPSRNLYLVASQFDDREKDIRATISIYKRAYEAPSYPGIVSQDRQNGTPIPFGSLSSLTTGACPLSSSGLRGFACKEGSYMYSVEDSHYRRTRIFKIDPAQYPAVIVQDIPIMDSDGVLARALRTATNVGEDIRISEVVNADNTVNLDAEGVDTSVARGGGFWVISEGDNDAGDDDCVPNYLLYLDQSGVIKEAIFLPDKVQPKQTKHGFEGVAEDYESNRVAVALQVAWQGEAHPRIAVYDLKDKSWKFYYYRLDSPESQDGGKVSIADIAFVGDGQFLVLERDHKGGPDAAVKRIYKIDLSEPRGELTILRKSLVFDVLGDLATATNGPVVKNVEGLTVDKLGQVYINTDNNGVDGNSGENLLLRVGALV